MVVAVHICQLLFEVREPHTVFALNVLGDLETQHRSIALKLQFHLQLAQYKLPVHKLSHTLDRPHTVQIHRYEDSVSCVLFVVI